MSDISSNLPVRDTADGTPAAAAPAIATQVGGSDGTNLRTFSTDTTGKINSNISTTVTAADKAGSGSIAALNATVVATTNGASTVVFIVTGTWVGTLVFEGQDGNGNWISTIGTVPGNGSPTSATGLNIALSIPCGGFNQMRVRASVYVSGTAVITYNVGQGLNTLQVFNLTPSALQVTNRTQDSSGNGITSTLVGSKQSLDCNVSKIVTAIDNTSSGTIVALNGTVIANTNGCSSVTFDVTGIWTATIVIEATVGDGAWFIVNGDVDVSDSISSSFTANTFVTVPCGSFSQVRLRASLFTSGTISITWNSSVGSGVIEVFNTNPASLMTKAQLQDNSGNAILAINNQMETRDVLNVSSQYRAQSITTTAGEALGAGTILVNRKLLHVTPTNGTIYWGYSNTVTTATGTPIFPNSTLWLSVTDNIHVWIIAGTTIDARIGEVS